MSYLFVSVKYAILVAWKIRHAHLPGLVSTAGAASIMGTQAKSWKFVDEVWDAKLEPYPDRYFDPYFDGLHALKRKLPHYHS